MTEIFGSADADTMIGTSGDDTFFASGGNDRIWGGTGGQDTLQLSGQFSDYAIRDNGNGSFTITDLRPDGDGVDVVRAIDTFVFTDMTLSMAEFAARGTNIMTGSGANDNLEGSATTNDLFHAGAGDDSIWGGGGGEDTIVYSGVLDDYDIRANEDGSYTITDRRGIDGTDKVRDIEMFRFADGSIDLDGFLATRPNKFGGTSGDDNFHGTSGNDHFFGGSGDDRYWGTGQGDDLLTYTGRFTDYVIIDNHNGSYTIIDQRAGSPDGSDVVRDIATFEFADRTATLTEFLSMHPSSFVRDGIGTSGDDIMHGSDGDDILQGFGGRDRIWGGKDGDDTVVFRGNFSDYVVTDNANGAFTVVDIRPDSPDGIAVVRDVETYQFADMAVPAGELLARSRELASTLNGTQAGDTISGAHTHGLFDAHTNDTIIGGDGDDVIRGGPGHDHIIGDAGAVSTQHGTSTAHKTADTDLLPFTDDSAFYQVRNGQLYQVDILTGESSTIGSDHHNYDAVGINPADGYAYGVGHSGPWTGHLLRIGADGNVESLGSGFQPTKSGGFAADGTLYLRTGTNEMTMVDVTTLQQTELSFGGETPPAVNDIVFIPNGESGTLYGVTVNGSLVAYELSSLSVWTASIDGALVAGGPYGSGWASEDGGLYFAHNRTGNIFAISGLENQSPTAALLSSVTKSNSADGFSLGNLILPEIGDAYGSDLLLGGPGMDHLLGGDGRDFLDGGEDADTLDGGEDIDTADYSRATTGVHADLATGGIAGEAAGDTYIAIENLLGSSRDDILIGDGQDNEITGRDGDDTILGGYGNDVLRGEGGADQLDGGDGFDIATYYNAADGVVVDLEAGIGSAGHAAGDILVSIEAVQGSNVGDDTLLGSAGEDNLFGFGGNDTLTGRDGSDALHGGDGDDRLAGGSGNDLLLGQDGDDHLDGGDGADNIQGGDGADVLAGGDGSDRLWGAAGNDVLDGGSGDDALRGGDGADTFVLRDGGGHDTIMDFMTGVDSIDFRAVSGVEGWDDLTISLHDQATPHNSRTFTVSFDDGGTQTDLTVTLAVTLWSSGTQLGESDFLF